jgi:hypothetical protein
MSPVFAPAWFAPSRFFRESNQQTHFIAAHMKETHSGMRSTVRSSTNSGILSTNVSHVRASNVSSVRSSVVRGVKVYEDKA